MTHSIGPIGNVPLPHSAVSPSAGREAAPPGGVSFQKLLRDGLQQTSTMESTAANAIDTSLAGGNVSQIEMLTALEQSDLALRTMLEIQSTLVEAYNEIQQMRL